MQIQPVVFQIPGTNIRVTKFPPAIAKGVPLSPGLAMAVAAARQQWVKSHA